MMVGKSLEDFEIEYLSSTMVIESHIRSDSSFDNSFCDHLEAFEICFVISQHGEVESVGPVDLYVQEPGTASEEKQIECISRNI